MNSSSLLTSLKPSQGCNLIFRELWRERKLQYPNRGIISVMLGCFLQILMFRVNKKLSKIYRRQVIHAQACNTIQICNAWNWVEGHWYQKCGAPYKNQHAQWCLKPVNTNSENHTFTILFQRTRGGKWILLTISTKNVITGKGKRTWFLPETKPQEHCSGETLILLLIMDFELCHIKLVLKEARYDNECSEP